MCSKHSLCCHYVSETAIKGRSFLALYSSGSDRTYSPVIQMGESRKPKEPVEDFSIYETEFRERLQVLLEDIFNPEIPFTQTEIVEKCTYCDFKTLCKR